MSTVTVTITCDGRKLADTAQLLSVDIRRELNRVPSAVLSFMDGDIATREYPLSDSGVFEPGKQVKIQARHDDQPEPGPDTVLFAGRVVRQSIESNARGTHLRVELRDAAVALTQPRRSRVLKNKRDSEVISSLLGDQGLDATVSETSLVHEAVVQYDCSDWDLLVSRAEANGQVVAVTDGRVATVRPDVSGAAELKINHGIDEVYELEFETDALGRLSQFKASTWDVQNQKSMSVTAGASHEPLSTSGRLTVGKAASALGFEEAPVLHGFNLGQEEARAWLDSEVQRAWLSLVRGRASLPGQGRARLLSVVQVDGVPKAFGGKLLVSGLVHRIDGNGWVTDLQFGLSPKPHRALADIQAPAAGGLWPAVGGLQVGVVTAAHEDPAGHHRVRVTLPALGEDLGDCWARVAMPDAGKERGWYFWPEVGDEVVLGFFNQDPRMPVVLGSLFSSKMAPPAAVMDDSDKNLLRGLVTRKGLTLAFNDDDKPQVWLQTPGKAKLMLDDDAEAVVLSDAHGNTLTMDKDGITLFSKKDITLQTDAGKVTLQGSQIEMK